MKKEAESCYVTSLTFNQSTWRHILENFNVRDTSTPRLNMGMIVAVPAVSACLARYGAAVTLLHECKIMCYVHLLSEQL
jgi:hypothetical protein